MIAWIGGLVVGGTILAYIIVGLVYAKRVKTPEDFFTAGGKLGIWPLVGTYVATYLSAVTVMGIPSGIYLRGFSFLWLPMFWSIGAVGTVIIAMRYKRLHYSTPADFFKHRYQSEFLVQLNSYVSVIALTFGLVAQFTAMGIVWSVALGGTYQLGVIIASVSILIIVAAGGLVSVAYSDIAKAIIFTTASILAAGYMVINGPSIREVAGMALARAPELGDLTLGLGGPIGVFFLFLTWCFGVASHPQYLIRISAAVNEKVALRQYLYSWPILAVINLTFVIFGLWGAGFNPELPLGYARDHIGAIVVLQYTPTALYALFLAGLTAAALSTTDSVIQLCASYLTNNVIKGSLKPDISDEALLKISRYFSVGLVIFVAIIASYRWGWITYIAAYAWGLLAILYFAPTVWGLYSKRANTLAATVSVVGGLATFLIAQTLSLLGRWPFGLEGPPVGVGVLAGVILMAIFTYTGKPPKPEQVSRFFKL